MAAVAARRTEARPNERTNRQRQNNAPRATTSPRVATPTGTTRRVAFQHLSHRPRPGGHERSAKYVQRGWAPDARGHRRPLPEPVVATRLGYTYGGRCPNLRIAWSNGMRNVSMRLWCASDTSCCLQGGCCVLGGRGSAQRPDAPAAPSLCAYPGCVTVRQQGACSFSAETHKEKGRLCKEKGRLCSGHCSLCSAPPWLAFNRHVPPRLWGTPMVPEPFAVLLDVEPGVPFFGGPLWVLIPHTRRHTSSAVPERPSSAAALFDDRLGCPPGLDTVGDTNALHHPVVVQSGDVSGEGQLSLQSQRPLQSMSGFFAEGSPLPTRRMECARARSCSMAWSVSACFCRSLFWLRLPSQ